MATQDFLLAAGLGAVFVFMYVTSAAGAWGGASAVMSRAALLGLVAELFAAGIWWCLTGGERTARLRIPRRWRPGVLTIPDLNQALEGDSPAYDQVRQVQSVCDRLRAHSSVRDGWIPSVSLGAIDEVEWTLTGRILRLAAARRGIRSAQPQGGELSQEVRAVLEAHAGQLAADIEALAVLDSAAGRISLMAGPGSGETRSPGPELPLGAQPGDLADIAAVALAVQAFAEQAGGEAHRR
ncbi:hypothetical protein [Longispora albida]|uniref:hypothetical protein n=1 Tax=Longispora albida TaxID=203523 RepID=UPI000378C5F9|nr:hypothetical protein [Longispora albida]